MSGADLPTVADLLAAEPETGSLFDRLGAITATAADAGVELTVNLEGRIVALTLAPEALTVGGPHLADAIARLAHQAAGVALSEGLATVAPFAGEDLTAELAEIVGRQPEPPPTRQRPPADDEDFSTIETWAIQS